MVLNLAYLAVVTAALSGLISVLGIPRRRLVRTASFALLGLSGTAAIVAGAWALVAPT